MVKAAIATTARGKAGCMDSFENDGRFQDRIMDAPSSEHKHIDKLTLHRRNVNLFDKRFH
jgi:hypothetical protein